jgi:hypothetical protein
LHVRIILFPNADYSCEAYLDSLQVEEAPTTHWHPGEATRAPTQLDARVSVCGAWTNVFTIQPNDLSTYLSHYGESSGLCYPDGDLDGDRDVDLGDLADLLGAYGTVRE